MYQRIALLLILSALALMSLVPGGPIETREFSHLSPLILSSFNLFLTTLGLGSFMLAYFTRLEYRWAVAGSLLAGVSYLVVYLLDLARIFPTSPTPMPTLLELIEMLGVLLALPVVYFSSRVLLSERVPAEPSRSYSFQPPKHWFVLGLVIAMFALAVIVFATLAAMGRIGA